MNQSQIDALEQRMDNKLMDLENKLNHVKEFATLKNNEVNQQLLKMATEITNIKLEVRQ